MLCGVCRDKAKACPMPKCGDTTQAWETPTDFKNRVGHKPRARATYMANLEQQVHTSATSSDATSSSTALQAECKQAEEVSPTTPPVVAKRSLPALEEFDDGSVVLKTGDGTWTFSLYEIQNKGGYRGLAEHTLSYEPKELPTEGGTIVLLPRQESFAYLGPVKE